MKGTVTSSFYTMKVKVKKFVDEIENFKTEVRIQISSPDFKGDHLRLNYVIRYSKNNHEGPNPRL